MKSVARWYDPFISSAIAVFAFFHFLHKNVSNVELVLSVVFLITLYQFTIEIIRSDWIRNNIPKRNIKETLVNIFTKYLGIIFGISLILFTYWLIPEYSKSVYLNTLNEAKYIFLPWFLPLSLLLVVATEFILGPKKDGTYQFGLLLRLKLEDINWKLFRDGILEWLVRLVFLTLNFTTLVSIVSTYRENGGMLFSNGFAGSVIALQAFIFIIIIFTILPGYVFSSRLIGTEVKKVDTSWFAWTITLICYQPFYKVISDSFVKYSPDLTLYNGSPVWVGMNLDFPMIIFVLGSLIILFELVHLWAEAILGIRSSNLSNRGIITNGPFRFTKHPVYVSKCFAWALAILPFINAASFMESFRLGLLFLILCIIFVGRSIAEEKLLSTDPDYVKYAEYMDKKGVFAFIGKLFPFMSFTWRHKYWSRHSN